MRGLLEAVPNFSVGRDLDVLAAIRAAIERHARVLDVHADADHNRSVFTCVGDGAGLVEGLEAGIAVAAERIDLARHEGVHPRVGVADVVPIVRFREGDPGPARVARALGERIGRLGIPVLGYAELGEGRRPVHFRAGGTAGLAAQLAAGDAVPLYGPARLHPTAGAVLLGVRPPLVAFNVDLGTDDVEVARAIAAAVRARDGGLPGVQALGLRLGRTGRAQVSMNLIDVGATPLHAVVAEVARLASERGVAVERGELVGLMPAATAAAAAGAALRIEGMAADRVLDVAVGGEFGR
ncbi:MAG TPA: glutamate formimidoyltransferase [Gaiellales bacterium]|nr:glutamate formimidoyltransferase [Gaiellales bacterium]